ncbi:MAG: Mce-associated rane protein [Mycobacterium sp.]|nr:Mce-associated rane protein [Mycobacterium sp.]
MTLVVEEAQTTAAIHESREQSLAPWHLRAGAFAIDVLPAAAVVTTMLLVWRTLPSGGVWSWVAISVLAIASLLVLVNRLLLPAVTGWSLGRAFCGIAVVRDPVDGGEEAPGAWTLLLRDLAHLLDTASLLVGWLWPLWDSSRRTFADMLLRTRVQRVDRDDRPLNIRRWTVTTVLTAAAVCLAGAATSYMVVYTQERATDQTRAQVAIQGPKIVAQMLTYDPKSLHDDFARALALATDKYRPQLAAQQDVVQKGQPVINEYWVTDSAIQSAGPDRATMLLFMHGRRSEGPEQRYITASVRVSFVKGADDRWRVDDLTVLTKPKPPGEGK